MWEIRRLPKSFGGDNSKKNIVKLTAREHFVAHRLLAKIYPKSGMVHAVFKMACVNKNTKYRVGSRVYEALRKAHAIRVSNDTIASEKKSRYSKGKPQSAEHIANRTKSRKENGMAWISEDGKKNISVGRSGQPGYWKDKNIPKEAIEKRKKTMLETGGWEWSDDRRKKQSERLTGKPGRIVTDEQKNLLSLEKKKTVECPYCGQIGQCMVMHRWHFDNCKKKEIP